MGNTITLAPPVITVVIGQQRSIELFEGKSDQHLLQEYLDQSIEHYFTNTLGHVNVYVVGCYNSFYGFFVETANPQGAVYSYNPLIDEDKLIRVADSVSCFYEIVQRLQNDWQPYNEVDYLPANKETVNSYQLFMQFVRINSPQSDPAFWEVLGFAELGVSLD